MEKLKKERRPTMEHEQRTGQIQIELSPPGSPQQQLSLSMPGQIDLPGWPPQLTIVGVRVLTGDQPQVPQVIDVMHEPIIDIQGAVYNQFIDLGSCASPNP